MKQLLFTLVIAILIFSCGTTKKISNTASNDNLEEAVVIANDSLEYEITIYDNKFSLYLRTIARPMDFYTQSYYENKNTFYVSEWNYRARNPIKYGDFYASIINYNPNVDYGIEVNYKLYNYFKFIRREYGIKLP